MKHKGPIVTLAAGLAVAAVLMVLNLSVTNNDDGDLAANNAAAGTPPASAEATPEPTAEPTTPPAAEQVTYAGNVDGGAATIAIAVDNGQAVAYVCDGKTAEAWLQGTATNGELSLTGADEAKITGAYSDGRASGDVWAAGKKWSFSVGLVTKPSGLYRATANVRGAEVVGGWIVVDGEQTGLVTVNGVAQPASPLDTETNSATVNDTQVYAEPVDGSGL